MMTEHESTAPASPTATPSQRHLPILGATLMFIVLVGGGYLALRSALAGCPIVPGYAEESEFPGGEEQPNGYEKWPKPLRAFVLSGQMHGYVSPCGCSNPQYGGLERRYNFIESLKAKKWDVVGIDMGELPQVKGIHAQNLLKYELSIKSLSAMNYKAVGIGKNEIQSPLGEALAQVWDKKNPFPRPIVLPLAQTAPDQMYYGLNVRQYEIIDGKPRVGVISMIGPDLREELKNSEKFLANVDELPKVLKAFAKEGVEVGVILHHEYPDPMGKQGGDLMERMNTERRKRALACVQFCAAERKKNPKIPPIQLVMVLTYDTEPGAFMMPLDPDDPKGTQVVEIGQKGKYVGLVGVYGDKKAYRLQYEMVLMSPDWKTKEGKEKDNPVIALFEKYNEELKRQDILALAPRSPHISQVTASNQKGLRSTFVGSDSCKECHPHAFKIWNKSAHADATSTLENLKHPSGRQYDPECMKCHTTGFEHPGGFNDPIANLANWPPAEKQKGSAVALKKHNDALRHVGCENCHGPASEHVKNPKDKTWYSLMNPFKPTPAERVLEDALIANPKNPVALPAWQKAAAPRLRALEQTCMKCHDQENDVIWGQEGKDIAARWLLKGNRLIHHTPKNNNGAGNPPPAKKNAPAAVEDLPPIVIEVIEDKK